MVILDFDGVLMDSVAEVAVSAYNAFVRKQLTSVRDLPDGLLDTFRRCRAFMRTPAEALPLMAWCLKRANGPAAGELDAVTFKRLCESSPLSAGNRRQRFFDARQMLMKKNPAAFLALNRPFQPLWHYLVNGPKKPIVMLTTKNRQAVLTLCRHFGLTINSHDIFSGDTGTTKTDNMKAIHRRFEASRYFFVDDLLQNLLELKNGFIEKGAALSLFLAKWGYGTAGDAVLAPKIGVKALDQKGVIDLLDTACFS